MASATTVMCPAPPNGGVPADIMGLTITCGGLTFSNFNVIAATGFSDSLTPSVSLVSVDQIGGSVNLGWNPNLTGANGPQGIYFYYQVSGAASGVGLTVGGVDATIVETVCSSAIPSGGSKQNVCAPGATEANFDAFSFPPGPNVNSAKVSGNSFSVYKGIEVVQGGALTSFTQSWTSGQVPEPATMLLIGTGFIGLGMLRRRLRKS
jgi:hypothetical protein